LWVMNMSIIPPVKTSNERPCAVLSRMYGDVERDDEKSRRRRKAFPDSDEPDNDAVPLKNRGHFMFTKLNERRHSFFGRNSLSSRNKTELSRRRSIGPRTMNVDHKYKLTEDKPPLSRK